MLGSIFYVQNETISSTERYILHKITIGVLKMVAAFRSCDAYSNLEWAGIGIKKEFTKRKRIGNSFQRNSQLYQHWSTIGSDLIVNI